MTAPLDQFVQTLAASRLMTADDVQAFSDGLRPDQKPESAEEFARLLIRYGKLTRFQAKSLLQGKTRGLVFGDYVVLDRIGAGGMGVVLKARHRRMDRVVALKVLAAKAVKSPEAVDRFHREVKAAARLAHPNIVTAYDAGESGGTHYLVMEYVAGHDLSDLVRQRGPLPEATAIDYVTQAAAGLQYAHDQNIIHRDIKPANLLLDDSGSVKILDMGLARFEQGLGEEDRERLTQSGQVMGTCDYMAPEQAEDTHRADRRADIYSLGCTLHRLLTGHAMYSGDTLMQVLLAHRDQSIPSLRAERPDISEQVDDVYRKMVAKRPEDRYQAMGEVVSALVACGQSVAVASGGQAKTMTFQAEEKGDSKLTAFLRGFSPDKQTIQRQADVDTGATEALPPAKKRKSQPWWLYGVIGVGAAAVLALLVVLMSSPGTEDEPSQVAQSEPSDPRPKLEPSERVVLQEQAELTATPEPPGEMPAPGSSFPEDPPQTDPEVEPAVLPEPSVPVEDPVVEARRQLLEAQREADAKWAAAMERVEASVAIWNFATAAQAIEDIQFEEPTLVERLEARRDEIGRMESLKGRIVSKLQQADPPLKKSDFRIRGIGGEITTAGPTGITTKTIQGDVERLAWNDLGTEATGRLLAIVVDSTNGDDCLAAALLAFASGDRPSAERFFDQAGAAGADISIQLGAMAAVTLTEAVELLTRGECAKAQSLLENLESKYAELPWLAVNRVIFDATLATADAGVHQAEAEALFAEAVEFHQAEALFDLRDAVERLTNDYGDCPAVTEANRDPSLADFQQAVADVGKFLTVRLDGQGDFTSIQAAIDAAEPNSLVEIQDDGPYHEQLNIGGEQTHGLTVRGGENCWPVVTWPEARPSFPRLVLISAPRVMLDQLIILLYAAEDLKVTGVQIWGTGDVELRKCVLYHSEGNTLRCDTATAIDGCFIIGGIGSPAIDKTLAIKNSFWVDGSNSIYCPARVTNTCILTLLYGFRNNSLEMRSCTVGEPFHVGQAGSIIDSVLPSIRANQPDVLIENCNVFGPAPAFLDKAKPGKGCFSAPPAFANPKMLDYRLVPGSPGTGKASDGGDLGVRYTPEMMEMRQIALKLRASGMIKF